MSIILDGLRQCCDRPVGAAPESLPIVKVCEPFNQRKRPCRAAQAAILAQQEDLCLYCGSRFGEWQTRGGRSFRVRVAWDHNVPFAYSRDNAEQNFVAACYLCNSIKSSMMFQSLDEARVYILSRRQQMGCEDTDP